jgi:hypothetical protein
MTPWCEALDAIRTFRRTNMKTIQRSLIAVTLCVMSNAYAADPATLDAAKSQYDAERARCMSGTTGQDQASCLRSAGAAYDAIKQNRLHDANTSYYDNEMSRCKSLPPADRKDCESRVDGQGQSSGSVKGGGMIKETTTTTTLPPQPVTR